MMMDCQPAVVYMRHLTSTNGNALLRQQAVSSRIGVVAGYDKGFEVSDGPGEKSRGDTFLWRWS